MNRKTRRPMQILITETMVSEALTRFQKSVPVPYTFNHFHNLTF